MTELFAPDLDKAHPRYGSLRERFNAKLGERTETGCLLWAGATDGQGRGKIVYQSRLLVAPRVAYFIEHGPFDDSLFILHSCDNGLCVEPSHLRTGTQQENMEDKYERDRARHPRGSAHGRAKLTDEQVLEIYRRVLAGEKGADLAEEFGVHNTVISDIKRGKSWSHLTCHQRAA